jgi:ribosomal protein L37AE/L43A
VYTQRKQPKTLADKLHEQAVNSTLIQAACDDSDWPECVECAEPFNPKRKALGYPTCLSCGEPKKAFTVVPVPKSNYIVASNISQVVSPYSHKGNR